MTKNDKKNIVKKKLWQSGYTVRDMGHVYHKEPFDLLVEGKFKVIFDSAPNKKQIRVHIDSDESIKYEYYKPSNNAFAFTASHMTAFGRPASRSN